jgi:hypothetical protein
MIRHATAMSIGELLDDPMMQAVMRADRVEPSELEAMLHSVARVVKARNTPYVCNLDYLMLPNSGCGTCETLAAAVTRPPARPQLSGAL